MSQLDTIINIDQSIRLRGLAKLSEVQLHAALNSNLQLVKLRDQLHSDISSLNKSFEYQNQVQQQALLLQKKQLEYQIQEIEFRETQSFHKERMVKSKELLDDFTVLNDPYVQTVFMNDIIPELEIFIDESRNRLTEISDKEYCVNVNVNF
jgi:hypothetical protein